ncbi:hypothetical protein KORDIASMS9_03207 [Kordia sp. SMS9]|uniref:hypothetical protein n=1 Tax=Kordia sp. SMS9 TaxID=2282170 RepID=UPI000E106092|nr:hypothetical protein [Kordia sp. SMS9]AXG70952.1 hypothetical protein KORDIASMS9_03207 [Kordia sp. SMS9]
MVGYLMRKFLFKKLSNAITDIELTKSGFVINEPFGAKPKELEWNDVKSIRFSNNDKVLIVKTAENEIALNDDQIGWFEFIQNIPESFKQFDFKKVNFIIDSLKSCEVCGIVAVRNNICKVCDCEPWNQNSGKSKIDYLKEKQIEHFEYELKNKKEIKKIAEPEHGFKTDRNWKLYI